MSVEAADELAATFEQRHAIDQSEELDDDDYVSVCSDTDIVS